MIVDLINSISVNRTSVSAFSVGTFTFDCQLDEGHTSDLSISDNAMESGAVMSDHSYLNPKTYTVRGIVVSYVPFNSTAQPVTSALDAAKQLPVLTGIVGTTEQAIAKVNRYAGTVLNAVNTVTDTAQILAPWLPESLSSLGDSTDSTLSRMAKAYDDLLTIQRNGELLTITTNARNYDNMLMVGASMVKAENDSVEFVLNFREVFIVETRTIQGLVVNVPTANKVSTTTTSKPDGANKTGRAANQAAAAKSKGKTQPVKTEKKTSILKTWLG